jgi:hypothetical protein
VDFVLDKFVGAFQQFSGNDNDRCSTVTDFAILLLSEFDKDLSGRVFDFKKLKDGSTIVTDGNVLEITTISVPSGIIPYSPRRHLFILTPISSTSILSNPTGPNELLTMLAIDTAAKTRFQIDDDRFSNEIIKNKLPAKVYNQLYRNLPLAERTSCPDVRSPPRNRLGLRSLWYMVCKFEHAYCSFGLEICLPMRLTQQWLSQSQWMAQRTTWTGSDVGSFFFFLDQKKSCAKTGTG